MSFLKSGQGFFFSVMPGPGEDRKNPGEIRRELTDNPVALAALSAQATAAIHTELDNPEKAEFPEIEMVIGEDNRLDPGEKFPRLLPGHLVQGRGGCLQKGKP